MFNCSGGGSPGERIYPGRGMIPNTVAAVPDGVAVTDVPAG